MATAERSHLAFIGAVGVVAALVAVASLGRSDGPGASLATPATIDVESSTRGMFGDLDELVDASDMIVVATVRSTERGPVVGGPDAAVISRTVVLDVESVVGTGARWSSVLLVEEGWLSDGTPIRVDGMDPSEAGDRGLWFLQLVEAEPPRFILVNSQGRFLDTDDGLAGADRSDPLVRQLEVNTLDELLTVVTASW